VSTEAPHDPYLVPRELFDRYDPEALELPPSADDDLADRPAVYRRIRRTWDALDRRRGAQAIACYYAACSGIDDQVGRDPRRARRERPGGTTRSSSSPPTTATTSAPTASGSRGCRRSRRRTGCR
jgi:hypothetical protein